MPSRQGSGRALGRSSGDRRAFDPCGCALRGPSARAPLGANRRRGPGPTAPAQARL